MLILEFADGLGIVLMTFACLLDSSAPYTKFISLE